MGQNEFYKNSLGAITDATNDSVIVAPNVKNGQFYVFFSDIIGTWENTVQVVQMVTTDALHDFVPLEQRGCRFGVSVPKVLERSFAEDVHLNQYITK